MSDIQIIYGTTGGNTQIVCQKVQEELETLGHKVSLLRCELAKAEDLLKGDVLILASPTYGHGVLESHFEQFLPTADTIDLAGKKCAVIALGDPKYDLDYFLESEKILTNFIETHGGEIITDPLKIAKSPLLSLEKHIQRWAEKLVDKLRRMINE